MSIHGSYRLILRCNGKECPRNSEGLQEVIESESYDSCLYTARMARGWEIHPNADKAFCPDCKKKLIRPKEQQS